jgi:hypothetical protein
MVAAVSKLSDVLRTSAAVFGSAPRFDGSESSKKASLNKVAQRKALYDKCAAVQSEPAQTLLGRERLRTGQTEDPLIAALNTTRPRLVQNAVMQPSASGSSGAEGAKTTRSAAAVAADRERREARERAQSLRPGSNEAQSALTQRRLLDVPS